jgi:hypothetical protein
MAAINDTITVRALQRGSNDSLPRLRAAQGISPHKQPAEN